MFSRPKNNMKRKWFRFRFSGYKERNKVCLVYLEWKLWQDIYDWCLLKLKWQKTAERTYLETADVFRYI